MVLYFYPKDDTPGCTKEACSFRDLSADFAEKGAVILGVSPDDTKSHVKFRDKFSAAVPAALGPGRRGGPAVRDLGREDELRQEVHGRRADHGRDRQGRHIKKVFPKVSVDGHVEEVLASLD